MAILSATATYDEILAEVGETRYYRRNRSADEASRHAVALEALITATPTEGQHGPERFRRETQHTAWQKQIKKAENYAASLGGGRVRMADFTNFRD